MAQIRAFGAEKSLLVVQSSRSYIQIDAVPEGAKASVLSIQFSVDALMVLG